MKTKTDAEIRGYLAKHPGVDARSASKNLGVSKASVERAISAGIPAASAASTKPSPRSTVRSLVAEFDDVGKVLKAMKELPPSEYVDDDALRQKLRISHPRWKEVKSHPKLADYPYLLPNKKTVWLHPAAQQELTKAIDLSQQ